MTQAARVAATELDGPEMAAALICNTYRHAHGAYDYCN